MSVHRRKTRGGVVWMVRYYENGRGSPRRVEKYGDEAIARQRDREIGTALSRGRLLGRTPPELAGARMTFAELTELWWDSAVRKPNTSATHAQQLKTWILPTLGPRRIGDLTPGTIKTWRTGVRRGVRDRAERRGRERRRKGKAPLPSPPTGDATADRCLAIVRAILAHGVDEGVLLRNVAAAVKPLRPARSPAIDARSPETIERIRRQMNQRDATLVSVLAYEGVRPAEAFTMRWEDVIDDLGAMRERLLVRRSLSARQIGETKNLRQRDPRLFRPVADDLREWWEACGRPARNELVFPDARGGVIRASNWHRRTWQPGLKSAGLAAFRPYDMRHTCATLLIYAGWNSLEVALHLGHGDPGFTLKTYGHVFRDATPDDRVPIDERIARARRSHA